MPACPFHGRHAAGSRRANKRHSKPIRHEGGLGAAAAAAAVDHAFGSSCGAGGVHDEQGMVEWKLLKLQLSSLSCQTGQQHTRNKKRAETEMTKRPLRKTLLKEESTDVELQMAPMLAAANMASTAWMPLGRPRLSQFHELSENYGGLGVT
ncbi:hypothetical protein EYF80_045159 [Liparis tanakae]|uniref:Uncharacterized protein n=1 Tax=Liparis tanakae TaxID=230148 RepID=A0A4Z2FTS5_9TELE|nr:hypothetical protein EYF80_045159 [Liparis tanakae]